MEFKFQHEHAVNVFIFFFCCDERNFGDKGRTLKATRGIAGFDLFRDLTVI